MTGRIDLGSGHHARWISDPATGEVIGLHEQHDEGTAPPGCPGGGWVAWKTAGAITARHELTDGGPDHPDRLTIRPSVLHQAREGGYILHPGCHGFITGGRWHDA